MNNSRRYFLKQSSLIAIAGMGVSLLPSFTSAKGFSFPGLLHEPFSLPKLPYSYDALEPNIDKMTMEIHHSKHHQAYVDNLNKAIAEGGIHASLDELISSKPVIGSSLKLRVVFALERCVKRFDGDHVFFDVASGVKNRA